MTRTTPPLRQHLLTRSDLARMGVPAAQILAWLAANAIEQVGSLGEHGEEDPVFTVAGSLRAELTGKLAAIGKPTVVLSPLRVRSFLLRSMLPRDEAAAEGALEVVAAASPPDADLAEVLQEAARCIAADVEVVLQLAKEEARLEAEADSGQTPDALMESSRESPPSPALAETNGADDNHTCFDFDDLASELDDLLGGEPIAKVDEDAVDSAPIDVVSTIPHTVDSQPAPKADTVAAAADEALPGQQMENSAAATAANNAPAMEDVKDEAQDGSATCELASDSPAPDVVDVISAAPESTPASVESAQSPAAGPPASLQAQDSKSATVTTPAPAATEAADGSTTCELATDTPAPDAVDVIAAAPESTPASFESARTPAAEPPANLQAQDSEAATATTPAPAAKEANGSATCELATDSPAADVVDVIAAVTESAPASFESIAVPTDFRVADGDAASSPPTGTTGTETAAPAAPFELRSAPASPVEPTVEEEESIMSESAAAATTPAIQVVETSTPATTPGAAIDTAMNAALTTTTEAMHRVESFLDQLKSVLIEMAQRPPAPAPVPAAPPASAPTVDVGPLVAALQAGFDRSAQQSAATGTALTMLTEKIGSLGQHVEHGMQQAVAELRRVPSQERHATEVIVARSERAPIALFAVAALVMAWATLFWFKTGSSKLALGTLIGANAVACCLLAAWRRRQ